MEEIGPPSWRLAGWGGEDPVSFYSYCYLMRHPYLQTEKQYYIDFFQTLIDTDIKTEISKYRILVSSDVYKAIKYKFNMSHEITSI